MNTSGNTDTNAISGVKAQLKQIGDQIETIAKQLRGQGNQQDIDQLFELGDKVEHFCDDMDGSAPSASQIDVKSANANQTGQKNQDDESADSQKPNPMM